MKKLSELKEGTRFRYGGVEWVKLSENNGEGIILSLAVKTVFDRAFDKKNLNNWKISSLRKELNEIFLEALVKEGAETDMFIPFVVDLTANDGMTEYGYTTDKIALLSHEQYHRFRSIIPKLDGWWWTVTPCSCLEYYSYNVRCVYSPRVLSNINACNCNRGVRPLCNLKAGVEIKNI